MRSALIFVACTLAATGAASGVAVGCSSSSSAPAGGDGGDASTSDATPVPEAALDTGPDNEQDPDVYPAKHHPIPQLDYHGGSVLQRVRIVTITFTGNKHRDALRAFDHAITTTDWWKQTAEGYCIDGGARAGCVGPGTATAPEGGAWIPDGSTDDAGDGYLDVELPYDFTTNPITDAAIQTWLQGHILAGDFPAPDTQTLYMVYLPGTTSIDDPNIGTSCVNFGAYHNATVVTPDAGQPQEVAYAAMPYCDLGQGDLANYQYLTEAASHEIAEAATDPFSLPAFYLDSNDAWEAQVVNVGGECGDMCFFVADPTYNESGYNVQRIWSNQMAALGKQPCQPWSQPYFAAALRTTPQTIPPTHQSDGYVIVKRGQSVDVVADVFSEVALPHDLLLYAGKNKPNATDPSDLAAPDNAITVSLSESQVHNGNGVVVTVSASSKSLPGPNYVSKVVLRAVLEKNDYNDWPFAVLVQ
jgi:hypothetical protein